MNAMVSPHLGLSEPVLEEEERTGVWPPAGDLSAPGKSAQACEYPEMPSGSLCPAPGPEDFSQPGQFSAGFN